MSSQALVLDAFAEPLALTVGSGSTTAVPEPGTLVLLGSGLAGLALRRRRNKI